jgi:hypothetical protein
VHGEPLVDRVNPIALDCVEDTLQVQTFPTTTEQPRTCVRCLYLAGNSLLRWIVIKVDNAAILRREDVNGGPTVGRLF